MKKFRVFGLFMLILTLGLVALLAACGDDDEHEHAYDNACDTTCNVCGEERTVTHDYSVSKNNTTHHWKECSVCGKEQENSRGAHDTETPNHDSDKHWSECSVCGYVDENDKVGHSYEYDCSEECEDCDYTRTTTHTYTKHNNDPTYHWIECAHCGHVDETTKEAHAYDNACDPDCNDANCDHTRTITHDYTRVEKDPDEHWTVCSVCGAEEPGTRAEHHYDYACDTTCDGCDETRTVTGAHEYTDDCDDECNNCHETRTAPHVYSSDCDTHCNNCGETREVSASHTYTDDCDDECNDCHETRVAPHNYAGDCDTECDDCGEPREVSASHTYTDVCDADCNICSETRVPPHDYSATGKDGTHHWTKCALCDEEQSGTRTAHSYAISGGKLACACGEEGTVTDLSAQGYAYADLSAGASEFTYVTLSQISGGGYDIVNENGSAVVLAGAEAGEYTLYAVKDDQAYKFPAYIATRVITDADGMNSLRYKTGDAIEGYYILGNDIDFKSAAPENHMPDSKGAGFAGVFNGLDYTIKNYVHPDDPSPWKTYTLFGVLNGATIKNVNFDTITISMKQSSALLAVYFFDSTVENVTIKNCKFSQGLNNGYNGGLLVGSYTLGTFRNISVYITGGNLHPLIGENSTHLLKPMVFEDVNIYNVANMYDTGHQYGDNGIVRRFSNVEVYNAFTGLTVYKDEGVTEWPFVNVIETIATETFADQVLGAILLHEDFKANTSYTVNGKQYTATKDGELSVSYEDLSSGTNTLNVTFDVGNRVPDAIVYTNVIVVTKIITTAQEMYALMFRGKDATKDSGYADNIEGYYVLGNDIDFAEEGISVTGPTDVAGWNGASKTIMGFTGTFNGNNHKIKNYTQTNQMYQAQSLFGKTTDATIKNIVFENVVLNGQCYSALFATYMYTTSVENITIDGVVVTSAASTVTGGILFGRHMTDVTFTDVSITMGEDTEYGTAGTLAALCGGSTGYGYSLKAATFDNVNIYKVKTLGVISRATVDNQAVYNTCTGLHIYSDAEGKSEVLTRS